MFQALKKLFNRDGANASTILFAGCSAIMVDVETMDTSTTAGVYAIGATRFVIGTDIEHHCVQPGTWSIENASSANENFLVYIHPDAVTNCGYMSVSKNTMDWTMEHNRSEYDAALRFGLSIESASILFNSWMYSKQAQLTVSNSPTFDHSILRNMYDGQGLKSRLSTFRDEFDVRTVGHLRHMFGMPRYPKRDEQLRLHSPLDDCHNQIKQINEFVQEMERRFK